MTQTLLTIRNLADIEQIEQTPFNQRVTANSTLDLIERSALLYPQAIAISSIDNGEQYQQSTQLNYQQLWDKIRQTANLFHQLNGGEQAVVTYLLPNLPQTHMVLWGAQAAGIVNPINPMLESRAIAGICQAAHTQILVTLYEDLNPELWQKVIAIRDQLPALKTMITIGGHTEHSIDFDTAISNQPTELTFQRQIVPSDIAALYHTGGTTGTPKLAKHTHENEINIAWSIACVGGLDQTKTLLCGLPLFHVNGTMITGLSPLSVGAHVVLLSAAGYRNPSIIQHFYKIVEYFEANFFSAVPTVLAALLDVPVANCDISSLEYVICGSAPLSTELFKRFEAATQIKILEGYGLTEGACASAVNPKNGQRKIGSIGLHLPYQQMKIVILDQHNHYQRDANIDEIGHVVIKGNHVFAGYVESRHNQSVWLDDGWFNTGDLGRKDKDHYFWLTGRKKELIIRGGHNIDPAQIEEVLYQLPDVQIAAAIACPHPRVGEIPAAFVQLKPNAKLTNQAILDYARLHIGERAAIPKQVIIIEQMPLTAVGKIFKPKLRWLITETTFQQALSPLNLPKNSFDIQVNEDTKYGTKAIIKINLDNQQDIAMIKQDINEILQEYTIHFEII